MIFRFLIYLKFSITSVGVSDRIGQSNTLIISDVKLVLIATKEENSDFQRKVVALEIKNFFFLNTACE